MKRYITIDGGTTNTRLGLIENGVCVDSVKLSIGAQKGMEQAGQLENAVKAAVEALIQRNKLLSSDITKILASGMITSEFGLFALPHITAPAGIAELHAGMKEVKLSKISDIPFVFIPGVKVIGEIENTDMMRGEETELIGLMDFSRKNAVYILPGSHSKIIKTDAFGRITEFSTMLTGEMIAALSQNTILKDAVDLSITETDTDYLVRGCKYALTHGLNNALFKVRILKNLFSCSAVECYSFFLGAVLSGEIEQIISTEPECAVIGGRKQIKDATVCLLRELSQIDVISVDDEDVKASTYKGAIRIYEYN